MNNGSSKHFRNTKSGYRCFFHEAAYIRPIDLSNSNLQHVYFTPNHIVYRNIKSINIIHAAAIPYYIDSYKNKF